MTALKKLGRQDLCLVKGDAVSFKAGQQFLELFARDQNFTRHDSIQLGIDDDRVLIDEIESFVSFNERACDVRQEFSFRFPNFLANSITKILQIVFQIR